MPCDELTIHLYVDGELPPDQAAACRRHLESCPACREVQRQIGWLNGVLRAVPEPRPRRGRIGWLVAPLTLAASLVLVWKLASVGPLPRPIPSASYHVELAGASHTVSVHGCELVDLAVGEDHPKNIDLERARIQ